MNIIVTLAGHSRRFQQAGYSIPKPFIEIDGRTMISHVVEMFDPGDRFFFVLNRLQISQVPDAVKTLKALAQHVEVIVIEPHECGPAYSALQVTSIPEDEEVIVTYCDFIVDWDYARFLRQVRGCDGAIAVFRGFHPASFGSTYYAYVLAPEGRMIELREKASFTPDRTQEYASAGIYYFRSRALFARHAQKLVESLAARGQEGYVSLLYIPIVQEKGEVMVYEVDRFICWGTPGDLEHYLFWSRYFKRPALEPSHVESGRRICNLIPMAGLGQRFRAESYRVSKPLIQVNGKPMVIAAVESFPPATHWIFEVLGSELDKHPIAQALVKWNADAQIVRVDKPTSGQAATCLLAKNFLLDEESELFIGSCDYQTFYDAEKWNAVVNDPTIDGAIWTYRMGSALMQNPEAFAYCRVGPDGQSVTEIVEKRTISDQPQRDPLVVGSFWYRRASDFVRGAESMIAQGITVNGEHYVGTSINTLLREGKRFVIFDIDQWVSFGNPFELHVYEYWQDHFQERAQLSGGMLP